MDKITILIVDDNSTDVDILSECLDKSSFRRTVVQNGESAIQQIGQIQPDLILLEVLLPGIDGFETCRRLKATETTRDIPVIFLTEVSDPASTVKSFEMGAVDYITKPFRCEELIARIHKHIAIHKRYQQLQKHVEHIEKQFEELKENNLSKDKFFSIIAHDLQSPVSSLQGLLQFVMESSKDYSKEQLEDTIGLVSKSADNLYALIENLLTWSRIQRGIIEYNPQNINVREIVMHNVSIFTPIANQKQIMLRNSIKEDIIIYADENMISAVVRNLLANALKFTYSGGTVDVSATQAEGSISVSVLDTGIGIKAEHLSKLFRIDAQYRRVGTAHERGTGLGLILCKEFVEQHGGKIWGNSEVDTGTTFTFVLPRKLL